MPTVGSACLARLYRTFGSKTFIVNISFKAIIQARLVHDQDAPMNAFGKSSFMA